MTRFNQKWGYERPTSIQAANVLCPSPGSRQWSSLLTSIGDHILVVLDPNEEDRNATKANLMDGALKHTLHVNTLSLFAGVDVYLISHDLEIV